MVKICGPKCSTCCSLLSLWGVIMLLLMGGFFRLNALAFIEDVPLEGDFNQTVLDDAYRGVSNNCFIAAAIYALFALLSIYQVRVNKHLQYQVD